MFDRDWNVVARGLAAFGARGSSGRLGSVAARNPKATAVFALWSDNSIWEIRNPRVALVRVRGNPT